MLRAALFLFVSFFASVQLSAGEQWASRVIKYSSQGSSKAYSARQVLGKPNALQYGKNPVAWAPAAPNLGLEYLEVGFERAQSVQQVAVFENFNPGAIYQIYLIEPSGKQHLVFEQQKPERVAPKERVFRYMMKPTSYDVSGVRLVLNTAETYGLNQIDAIGISSASTPMMSVINNPTDKSFVGKPENLGYTVNSEDPDLLPIISVNGEQLYFARKHHVNNIGAQKNDDIYVASHAPKGGWTEAYNIGAPLNNEYNNFVCAVNPDGTELLISGRYDINGTAREGLHRATFRNGKWQAPQPIIIENYNNLSPFVCYHVSPDMRYLVIAMEHPDTYGDMDIYVAFQKGDGRYSAPRNLGPTINTAGTEPSVFLSADGKTIYFASDGHPGYGAYDMFMSRRLDNSWERWTEPVNLGSQINTPDWDLYYTVPASGEYAYYSSEHNSYGRSDLYRIKLPKDVRPEPVAVVQPSFVNVRTNTPIESLEKQHKTIVLSGDSKVDLYQEVKGYYPVNTSPDLSAEMEDVDDFGNTDAAPPPTKEDMVIDERMEDLLARLQELKKQEASTDNQYEEITTTPVPSASEGYTIPPANARYTSDLDDQIAALRSDMQKINERQQGAPEKIAAEDNDPREKEAGPSRSFEKQMDEDSDFLDQQQALQQEMEKREEAIANYKNQGSYRPVSPRGAPSKQYYDLRDQQPDEFGQDYRSYRDELEELKQQKDKAAIATQPLTKYALSGTGIDDETKNELVASSLSNELNQLRDTGKPQTTVDPALAAYQKKLDALRQEKEVPASTGGTRINAKPEQPEKEESEEVLAFRQKLDEMKAKMDNIPVAPAKEGQGDQDPPLLVETPVSPAQETDPAPVQLEPETAVRDSKRKDKKGNSSDENSTPIIVSAPAEKEATAATTEVAPAEDPVLAPVAKAESEEMNRAGETAPSGDATDRKLAEEVDRLSEEAESARAAVDAANLDKKAAEEASRLAALEKERLEAENLAMQAQKEELKEILAQLEAEKQRVQQEQQKMEADRKALEKMRLEQHLQVKKLEDEIAQLERQKKEAQQEAPAAAKAAASASSGSGSNEIFLMPVEAGVTVEIRNVFFNANSAYIKPVSYRELDKVATFLKVNQNISVEVGGHTNGLCSDSFCVSLSEKRAKSVSEYLVSKGVDSSRVTYKGYGKSQPVASNDTNEGRKQNQRVELKILEVH